jgi:hypothetical protein
VKSDLTTENLPTPSHLADFGRMLSNCDNMLKRAHEKGVRPFCTLILHPNNRLSPIPSPLFRLGTYFEEKDDVLLDGNFVLHL